MNLKACLASAINTTQRCLGAATLGFLLTGCHSLNVSEPKRTATEQLLLSTAADRGLEGVDLAPLRGKKVFLEEQYFRSYDQEYILGAIRELISRNGAFLMRKIDEADMIVEARSGGLGIDSRTNLFGIPAIPIPIPMVGTIGTPEIALWSEDLHDSTGKFVLLAYDNKTGAFVHSTGSLAGKAYFYHYKVLGIFNWRRTDIPELNPRVFHRVKETVKP
jgi:hypothetical protein